MKISLKDFATFGIAGNFTGHLEQAGEAADFVNTKTADAVAPKAIFPTYIPKSAEAVPEFLTIFPFDSEKILYPVGQDKLQIEPECAVLFNVEWEGDAVKSISPFGFGASNDCSIRREGAKKISHKKNWGKTSKGFSDKVIPISTFDENSVINDYRIASYLVRDNEVFQYGEDSAIKDYSYIYSKLINWIIDKLNNQQNEGPAEKISDYLVASGKPEKIMISIGATRYTKFGETNYLKSGDKSVVILYPSSVYTSDEITELLKENKIEKEDISVLSQLVVNE